jgi:hypothetical protein
MRRADENDGGFVLFDEFCKWLAHRFDHQKRYKLEAQHSGRDHPASAAARAERGATSAVPCGAELKRLALESGLSFGDVRGKSDSEIRVLMRASKVDTTLASSKQKTRGALLGGLRDGSLEAAVAKMEEDTAEPEPSPLPQKQRSLFYAVELDTPHVKVTVSEFAKLCNDGRVSRSAVMIWTDGMAGWALPDSPEVQVGIPELAVQLTA